MAPTKESLEAYKTAMSLVSAFNLGDFTAYETILLNEINEKGPHALLDIIDGLTTYTVSTLLSFSVLSGTSVEECIRLVGLKVAELEGEIDD